jgi:hypothetical protein
MQPRERHLCGQQTHLRTPCLCAATACRYPSPTVHVRLTTCRSAVGPPAPTPRPVVAGQAARRLQRRVRRRAGRVVSCPRRPTITRHPPRTRCPCGQRTPDRRGWECGAVCLAVVSAYLAFPRSTARPVFPDALERKGQAAAHGPAPWTGQRVRHLCGPRARLKPPSVRIATTRAYPSLSIQVRLTTCRSAAGRPRGDRGSAVPGLAARRLQRRVRLHDTQLPSLGTM